MPRWISTLGTTTAAAALAGLALFGGAATASADPTPGYPGGYPGGGYTGGGTPGGIDTTNPTAGGPVTVTAACATGAGATLTFDGSQIAKATVSGGSAVLTGTVPAGTTGAHTVVATCDSGQTYTFNVTVQAAGSAGSPSGALASTGAKVATFTAGGLVLVAVGFGLVLVARRRATA